MSARKHVIGVMRASVAVEKNSRRYDGEVAADRAALARVHSDLFPETRVDPTIDGDQRFTTRETDLWCRKVAGVEKWDLDVAACEESHLAPDFYTKADDGLSKRWCAKAVWCNPPFSDIEPWVQKAIAEMLAGGPDVIAMLLPASRTEQAWWQNLVEPRRDRDFGNIGRGRLTTHFLPGRTRFGHPGNPEGVGVGSPPFGCVLLVWRRS